MGVDGVLIISMVAFSFASAISPGPNNTVLMALAANFGPKGPALHLAGMGVGHSVMLAAMSAGLGAFFLAYPVVYEVLKYVGFAYILYMAWGILKSRAPEDGDLSGIPVGVIRSTLFQWVNPKAWIVIATFVTAYMPTNQGIWVIVWSVLIFLLATFPGALVWAVAGHVIGRVLRSPKSQRIFTVAMAIALVASMIPIFFL